MYTYRYNRSKETPTTLDKVKTHMVLLIVQAMFIVSLGVVGLYAELKANYVESKTIAELRVMKENRLFAKNAKPLNARVAGVSDSNNADSHLSNGTTSTGENAKGEESLQIELLKKILLQMQQSPDAVQKLLGVSGSMEPAKTEYSIAVYGDSMVDTMGERLEYLEHELTAKYPGTTFKLYNYGMGSNNADDGLKRWNSSFKHMDRSYPSIAEVKPDIIIMGSFAYNVFTPHNRDHHWLALTELVQKAQILTPHVYMLAENAPLRRSFGLGPNGVNWSPATSYSHSGNIFEQLKNAIGLSEALQIPLIDGYTDSLVENKDEGQSKYVNPSDGIHPSVEGHQYLAKKIADMIELY